MVQDYAQEEAWEQIVGDCRSWVLSPLSYDNTVSYQEHSISERVLIGTDKALKGYTDMNIALEPAGEEDVKRYKEWMETSRPLVKAEGMVLIGHPEDLACLQRRTDTDTLDIINSWKQESKKDRRNSNSEIFEVCSLREI